MSREKNRDEAMLAALLKIIEIATPPDKPSAGVKLDTIHEIATAAVREATQASDTDSHLIAALNVVAFAEFSDPHTAIREMRRQARLALETKA
jgi:hypothetical protein